MRKNKNKSFFESAYKDKYMCWLSVDTLHMRAAEVVTFRSNQGAATTEKVKYEVGKRGEQKGCTADS